MRDKIRRAKQWREGGKVLRTHGTPVVGHYDVAQHSFNAALLALILHPTMRGVVESSPEGRLLVGILLHDLHERYLGDMYGPAKWLYPDLMKEYEHAQFDVEKKIGAHETLFDLEDPEMRWLKAVDTLELQMFAEDQAAFGNRHTEKIRTRVANRLAASKPPPEVDEFLEKFEWSRTDEEADG